MPKNREQFFPLIINSSNLISSSYNNTYRYNFPAGSVRFNNSKVTVANISIFYSWFNITADYGNNIFQIIHPIAGAGNTTITVTIPDGFYDAAGLNAYLQQILITNNLYLVNAAGDYVYYLEILANANYYALQLNTYAMPTVLPAGWTNPAGMAFPATTRTPQFVVLSNAFREVIGFVAGSYPAVQQLTNYSVLSTSTPQITPVQSLLLSCSLLNNRYAVPNTILYSFSPANTTFGSLISSSPTEFSFIDIQDGSYSYFEISFLDQNFDNLFLRDTNLVVQLLIRNEDNNF